MNLIFATTNRGKLAEAQTLARQHAHSLDDPNRLSEQLGSPPDVEENADSYLGNAQKKGVAYYAWCKRAVVADDSGLEVDALNGLPGVMTARFAGPNADDSQNRAHLLRLLKPHSNRNAVIRCILYTQFDAERFLALSEAIEVQIAAAERGTGGFGYDPLLFVPSMGLTLAEIKQRQLPFETHRIRAFNKLFALLNNF